MIQLAACERLLVVHALILQGRRGNAAQLVDQSERSVYRCLAQIRELGVPLVFYFIDNCYHYRQP